MNHPLVSQFKRNTKLSHEASIGEHYRIGDPGDYFSDFAFPQWEYVRKKPGEEWLIHFRWWLRWNIYIFYVRWCDPNSPRVTRFSDSILFQYFLSDKSCWYYPLFDEIVVANWFWINVVEILYWIIFDFHLKENGPNCTNLWKIWEGSKVASCIKWKMIFLEGSISEDR